MTTLFGAIAHTGMPKLKLKEMAGGDFLFGRICG
jgi:hypothetical protein